MVVTHFPFRSAPLLGCFQVFCCLFQTARAQSSSGGGGVYLALFIVTLIFLLIAIGVIVWLWREVRLLRAAQEKLVRSEPGLSFHDHVLHTDPIDSERVLSQSHNDNNDGENDHESNQNDDAEEDQIRSESTFNIPGSPNKKRKHFESDADMIAKPDEIALPAQAKVDIDKIKYTHGSDKDEEDLVSEDGDMDETLLTDGRVTKGGPDDDNENGTNTTTAGNIDFPDATETEMDDMLTEMVSELAEVPSPKLRSNNPTEEQIEGARASQKTGAIAEAVALAISHGDQQVDKDDSLYDSGPKTRKSSEGLAQDYEP